MNIIKDFLKRKHEYSNLSMIIRSILWIVYGAMIIITINK